jgi:hypothetical protein
MQRTLSLRGACAGDIPACLQDLAQVALTRQGSHSAPYTSLSVLKVEPQMLPLGINPPATVSIWGIYSQAPIMDDPIGDRLLGATVELCPGCGDSQCNGNREIILHLTQTPAFPLPAADVNWYIYKRFGMEREAEACIPKPFQLLYRLCNYWNAEQEANNAQLGLLRGPGAPQLQANANLLEKMRALPDPRRYTHLREGWKEDYLAEKGKLPVNWEKRFRQAAEHCIHQILDERTETDDG